ncbi:PH domain-containing protein [Planctomicrobium sp. SH527]|uniref:PH domain-containing protein n=1 Tax=Planctomicrobium sp. SH527 TaxID=3448123 RepID=UPI003F5C5967
MAGEEWFFKEGQKTYGPVELHLFQKLIDKGRITNDTLVRQGKTGKWTRFDDLGDSAQADTDYAVSPPSLPSASYGPPDDPWGSQSESVTASQAHHSNGNSVEHAYLEPSPSFSERSRQIGGEVLADLLPRSVLPKELKELIGPREKLLYADRPSETVLYLRIALASIIGILQNIGILLSSEIPIFVELILLLFTNAFLVALPAYCVYLDWANRYYVITNHRLFVRWGVFNRRIQIAPIRNIQMMSINTGIIDRWLNLNTVHFHTAANSHILSREGTSLYFRWIDSSKALRAFGSCYDETNHSPHS